MPEERRFRYNKKFRFQLLAQWISENYQPCKTVDIGGGKGLLSYFLNKSGFDCTVIDPFDQALPNKYKDIETGKRVLLNNGESVKRLTKEYKKEDGENFDLLIGMHAHGCNMLILETAIEQNKDFILLPCCVIGEPIEPKGNMDWFESLDLYARYLGHETKRKTLFFKGQATILYNSRG